MCIRDRFGGLLQIVEERATMHCVSNCSVLNTERSQIPSSWRCEPINNTSYCQLEEDTPTVNVWWVWGLIIAMIVPDIYSLILSSWRWCFKNTAPFDYRMLILVSVEFDKIYLHFIRNARLKSIRSFEWFLHITSIPYPFWCGNIRTTFFHGNIAQLHQFTHL